jgi:hypothetical protein
MRADCPVGVTFWVASVQPPSSAKLSAGCRAGNANVPVRYFSPPAKLTFFVVPR